MESIISFVQCNWCLEQYSEPIVLPCGNTVCEKHTKELRNEGWKCRLCGGTHKMADGEKFPTNNIVVDMLAANLSRLDFGPTYKAAKEEVDALESKKAELKHFIDVPADHAFTLCKKYTNQVDLGREEILKIVDAVCESKNKLITEYKRQVEKNLGKTSCSKKQLVESVDLKIKKWRQSLRDLVVNEARWKEIVNEAQVLQKEIKSQLESGLDLPPAIQNLSKSIKTSVWSELGKSIGIREYKLSEIKDEKSVLISQVSKNTKSINSEPFTFNDAKFKIFLQYKLENGENYLGVFLMLLSDPPKKVACRFNVLGKYFEIIKYQDLDHEVPKTGIGYDKLITIKDILAHPAYDAAEDAVRVEVVFKE